MNRKTMHSVAGGGGLLTASSKSSIDASDAGRTLSEFFNRSHVGLAVFDNQLRYRMLNPYLAISHNTPIESHLGKHIREILGAVANQVEPAIRRVIVSAAPMMNCNVAGALPTRREKTSWMSSYFPVLDSNGNVTQVGAVVVELEKNSRWQGFDTGVSANPVLRSWKEIAQYVGACVKTVQRWERAHEFPVRRVNPTKGSVVFAFQNELEEWLRSRTLHPETAEFPRSGSRR